jgi:hypothetical protein
MQDIKPKKKNPFAESYRAKNDLVHKAYARKEALARKVAGTSEGKSHITGNIYKH